MQIPGELTDFLKATATLLIVLDPLAASPLFFALVSYVEPKEVQRIIFRVIGGATVLLLFFIITGTWVLQLFGVTIDDLRVGGGLLLLVISLRLVIEGKLGAPSDQPGTSADYRTAVVPIISPLLIGPGAITAAVVLARIHGIWLTSLASLAAMLLSLIFFLAAKFINRLLGESGTDLVSRIMGVLIAAIAVSYIRQGIIGFMQD